MDDELGGSGQHAGADLRQGCRRRGGDRGSLRRAGRHQYRFRQHQPQRRYDRAGHAGNGRHALCHLGSGCGRWSRSRSVDGGRSSARHRQRAQPRHLLQDDRPERADGPPSDRVACPSRHRGNCRRLCGFHETIGHSGDGFVGVLTGSGRTVSGTGAGRLVEAGELGRRDRGYDRRLWPMPLLPARHALWCDRLLRNVERHLECYA